MYKNYLLRTWMQTKLKLDSFNLILFAFIFAQTDAGKNDFIMNLNQIRNIANHFQINSKMVETALYDLMLSGVLMFPLLDGENANSNKSFFDNQRKTKIDFFILSKMGVNQDDLKPIPTISDLTKTITALTQKLENIIENIKTKSEKEKSEIISVQYSLKTESYSNNFKYMQKYADKQILPTNTCFNDESANIATDPNIPLEKYECDMPLDEVVKFCEQNLQENAVQTHDKTTLDENLIAKAIDEYDFDFIEPVLQWMEYRRQIKQPYKTVSEVKALFNYLQKLSNNHPDAADYIVQKTIAGSYKNLIEITSPVMKKFENPIPLRHISDIANVKKSLSHWVTLRNSLLTFNNLKINDLDMWDRELNRANKEIITALKYQKLKEKYLKNTPICTINKGIKNYHDLLPLMTNNTKILFVGWFNLIDDCYSCLKSDTVNKLNKLLADVQKEDVIQIVKNISKFECKQCLNYDLIDWAINYYVKKDLMRKLDGTAKYKDILNDARLFATLNDLYIAPDLVALATKINEQMVKYAVNNDLDDSLYKFLLLKSERKNIINSKIKSAKQVYDDDYLNFLEQYKNGNLNNFINIIDKFKVMANTA